MYPVHRMTTDSRGSKPLEEPMKIRLCASGSMIVAILAGCASSSPASVCGGPQVSVQNAIEVNLRTTLGDMDLNRRQVAVVPVLGWSYVGAYFEDYACRMTEAGALPASQVAILRQDIMKARENLLAALESDSPGSHLRSLRNEHLTTLAGYSSQQAERTAIRLPDVPRVVGTQTSGRIAARGQELDVQIVPAVSQEIHAAVLVTSRLLAQQMGLLAAGALSPRELATAVLTSLYASGEELLVWRAS